MRKVRINVILAVGLLRRQGNRCTGRQNALRHTKGTLSHLQPHDSISLKFLSDFGEVSRIVLHVHQGQELLGEHLREGGHRL